MTKTKQLRALDGIRGLAILLVFLIHFQQIGVVPERFHLLNVLMHAGWSGVDLFFVLSGFLITLGLLDSKEADNYFSSFYMRRVLRIFPLYYGALAAVLLARTIFGNYSPHVPLMSAVPGGPLFLTWRAWCSHLFYVQNWWMPMKEPEAENVLSHFWSLGVEEQFYLIWPLCIWMLPRKRVPLFCLAACAAVLGLRFYVIHCYAPFPLIILMNTFTRADTLMAGAFCAAVTRDRTLLRRTRPWLPLAAGLGLIYLAAVFFGVKQTTGGYRTPAGGFTQLYYVDTAGFTAFALIFSAMVMWAYLYNESGALYDRIFSIRPLTNLGKYSYGLYVYHLPLIFAGKIWFGTRAWFGHEVLRSFLFCAVTAAVSFGVAVASYELFEKRFLRLKRRFEPNSHHEETNRLLMTQPSTAIDVA